MPLSKATQLGYSNAIIVIRTQRHVCNSHTYIHNRFFKIVNNRKGRHIWTFIAYLIHEGMRGMGAERMSGCVSFCNPVTGHVEVSNVFEPKGNKIQQRKCVIIVHDIWSNLSAFYPLHTFSLERTLYII